jgi:hypothetical protein
MRMRCSLSHSVEVNDLPPVVAEHDEDVQDTEGHGGNREEVAGGGRTLSEPFGQHQREVTMSSGPIEIDVNSDETEGES